MVGCLRRVLGRIPISIKISRLVQWIVEYMGRDLFLLLLDCCEDSCDVYLQS